MENFDFLNGMDIDEKVAFLVNLNRIKLNRLPYIKKYNKLRKLHSYIYNDMFNYMMSSNYNYKMKAYEANLLVENEINDIDIGLDYDNDDDRTIIFELFFNKNLKDFKSITEIFLEKKKYRNKEKLALLNAMNNSVVGLFKIIGKNSDTGYVTYEDVFTHKKYDFIDTSLCVTAPVNNSRSIYMYNRLITIDGITFGTGMHIMMTSNNKKLLKFIKKHKYNRCSDFARCLMLYDISKKDMEINATYNHRYSR